MVKEGLTQQKNKRILRYGDTTDFQKQSKLGSR